MTKKEFDKYKRFIYKNGSVLSGSIDVFVDCPDLDLSEDKRKEYKEKPWMAGGIVYYFKHISIQGDKLKFIYEPHPKSGVDMTLECNSKWIRKVSIHQMRNWEDKGGKRESKLNWVLKNMQDVS